MQLTKLMQSLIKYANFLKVQKTADQGDGHLLPSGSEKNLRFSFLFVWRKCRYACVVPSYFLSATCSAQTQVNNFVFKYLCVAFKTGCKEKLSTVC